MPVNFTGTYAAIRAFVPMLIASGGGHIVDVLSLLSVASMPPMAGSSASRAAAHSLMQVDAPKTPLAAIAASLLDGLADDLEDIFPDPNAEAMAGPLADSPEGVKRAFCGAVAT